MNTYERLHRYCDEKGFNLTIKRETRNNKVIVTAHDATRGGQVAKYEYRTGAQLNAIYEDFLKILLEKFDPEFRLRDLCAREGIDLIVNQSPNDFQVTLSKTKHMNENSVYNKVIQYRTTIANQKAIKEVLDLIEKEF